MDYGHELTEMELKKLESKILTEYTTAVNDMQRKLKKYLNETEVKRQYQESLLKAGKITQDQYKTWCYNHTMVGNRWKSTLQSLTMDLMNANKIAMGIAKGEMPNIYALNANYAMYQIEHDAKISTGFTLYDHDTAEYLLGDQRQLMPKPSARKAKEIEQHPEMRWSQEKIQSAVLQGVLQGESSNSVAQRLRKVGQMAYNDAVRYARTMTTSAQNAGRYQSYREAEALGVDLTIEWSATLDHRTRHDHRLMHGQRTDVDKPFRTPDGYTIYYPADCTGESTAPQSQIWNCRCTLLAWVKGFEHDKVTSSPKMGDMTYEEWLNEKPQTKPYPQDPNGTPKPSPKPAPKPTPKPSPKPSPKPAPQPAPKPAEQEKPKKPKKVKSELTTPKSEPVKVADSEISAYLDIAKIDYNPVTRQEKKRTEDEIIRVLSGGDRTKGSCASLGLAYCGQKSGLDVLDFRGGESCNEFSHSSVLKRLKNLPGIDWDEQHGNYYLTTGNQLLRRVQQGKQYWFACGRHAAIVQKGADGKLQYLELQSQTDSGWQNFNGNARYTLSSRFGAPTSRYYDAVSFMFDVDSVKDSPEFAKILGYLNTPEDKQMKGKGGTIK